jgi:Calpain family cysteine protease
MIITIDDYVPFYNGNLIFERVSANDAGKANDMNIWSVLLEKAFAKITGNYEYINYGW